MKQFDEETMPLASEGVPDGMTIDTDDNIWLAQYNGGKVTKWDPRKGME